MTDGREPVTVLKLGGSVVTVKDEPETVDDAALSAAAAAVGATSGPLVVVHGGGSFGHYHAQRHGVTGDSGTRDAAALSEIHGAMTALSEAVVGALQAESVPALPVRPLSAARREADGLRLSTGSIERMLAEGFVPVTHGDVIATAGSGGTVLSGDDLVVSLASSLDAGRVGLCSAVPGVLDGSGAVVDRIDRVDDVEALGASAATDVTGGMAAKVEKLLALEVPAQIFGADGLTAFLDGGNPGTAVRGE